MYRDNGVEKGYEDAIPVKRSRRSEKMRSRARLEAAGKKTGVDFVLNRTEAASRRIPVQKDALGDRDIAVQTAVATENKAQPKPVRPPVRPKFMAVPEVDADENLARKDVAPMSQVPEVLPESKEVLEEDLPQDESAVSSESQTNMDVGADELAHIDMSDEEVSETSTDEIDEDSASHSETKESASEKVASFATIYRERSNAVPTHFKKSKKGRLTVGKVIGRFFLSVFTMILILVITLFGGLYTVATGPSESVRDTLVLSALQASATKWIPGIFLEDAVVDQILADSQKVNTDVVSVEDYGEQQTDEEIEDKWANAIDGILYEPVKGPTFKGYVLLIRDPSRVSVGVATERFSDATIGMRIFDMADKYNAVAAINGGEYPDAGGMGSGGRPIGLTYSGGECVWSDGLRRSFMGFDKDNKLIVCEGLTKAQAESLGIRDGVCFKTGKTLITNEDGNVTMYYADKDTGTAQRTAIGQAADGTVIFLVTDGRSAGSLGATHNDVIDVMVSYGAISAGMLDGGSSSLMYYRDFYDKYGLDKTNLDEYQLKGLINKYKAFTNPRRLPTCFIVAPE